MTQNFYEAKRIKRFGETISVLKNGNFTVYFIENEKYSRAYEKIFALLERFDERGGAVFSVTFAGEDYVSFLCLSKDEIMPLNFSLLSGMFERDSIVLKYRGITRRRLKNAVKRSGMEFEKRMSRVYLIPGGVGVICDKEGKIRVKIRQ